MVSVSLDLSTSDLLRMKFLALEVTVSEDLVLVTSGPRARESPPLSPCLKSLFQCLQSKMFLLTCCHLSGL